VSTPLGTGSPGTGLLGTAPLGPAQLARLLRLPEPTAEQAAVISAPLGPLAVITFTRKAAAEFADRVRSRLDRLRRAGLDLPAAKGVPGADEPFPGDPVIGTYHAYAGRLVGDNALREGLEPSMRLITPALSWQLGAQIVAAYDGPMDEITWTPQTVTAAVLELAGDLSEHLRDTSDVSAVGLWLTAEHDALPGRVTAAVKKILANQRAREQLLPLVSRYAKAKAAREVLDHGDQVALAARIASRHPEVGAAERARYQVVLLDEYQDTSHAQLVLLRALFGGGHPVTAVGDPCQSIYGWRGASAGNLRRFTADFPVVARGRPFGAPVSFGNPAPSGPAPVLKLSTSFRNSARVLDAAAVIQDELRYEAPDVPRLVSAPDRAERGVVSAALLETSLDEAEWVAAQAAALLATGRGLAPDGQPWPEGLGLAQEVRHSDIAVLCRKRAQFVALRHALEARGIPVEVVGLGGLLAVPEVQDVVATLRVLHDAGASDALARLLTGPRWRIGPRDLVALGRRARVLASGEGDGRAVTRAAAVEQDPQDALAEAVTDLTAETGSLVEALDDLGEPAAYSRAGYARMHALAGELRRLRAHVGRPLADLTAEAERVLGLDIEVAARPGVDPVAARADLDAFTDVADAFTGEGAEPTLGAFLAYLAAAQQEEFGLETGRVGESDSVKLLTVHAAKGLQWPAVFVPGLAVGERSQMFPARPRVSTRWTDNPRLIPFGLRGDAGDLPELLGLDASSLEAFGDACATRDLSEERRLMYVAATRAAFWLGCSGYWWGEGGSSRLGPSPFLEEVRRSGVAEVSAWADEPEADAENPLLAAVEAADWPATPAGRHYDAVRSAAALVQQALAHPAPPAARRAAGQPGPSEPDSPVNPGDHELVTAWERDAGLLLAERAERRGDGATQVPLPVQLSVSSLVALARDPAELARQVRRPMPRPPASQARRGTAFHQWLEQRYGQQLLIDDNALFGPDDDPAADGDLAALQSRFEQSEWAERWPQAVEVPFETLVGDRLVRGRIDAVFGDAPGGGYDVVDWKTGTPPRSEAERHAVAVQLAAYRLAWAALAGVPVSEVRAAFYYVARDQTVRPADLLDEAGLAALIDQVPAETPPPARA
jgi:DNA helicase-2/ATP-dependent DNA helicase PcrA